MRPPSVSLPFSLLKDMFHYHVFAMNLSFFELEKYFNLCFYHITTSCFTIMSKFKITKENICYLVSTQLFFKFLDNLLSTLSSKQINVLIIEWRLDFNEVFLFLEQLFSSVLFFGNWHKWECFIQPSISCLLSNLRWGSDSLTPEKPISEFGELYLSIFIQIKLIESILSFFLSKNISKRF